ncbi:ATP-dependent helicase HrpB [Terriglobus albidus]|uniref:ATP-dependent helicase HrpB n=1 Tax=Terriglobus albidus TaxID=1592106 RepID=UPI001FE396DC|nr:ATP-dependent helicase HrpB [Terriglobus albidus]
MNVSKQLPVDLILPEVVQHLLATPSLVIEAAPGAGKTTRVPPALLKILPGEVIVLEPRRIAARMAARRVAQEMGEQVGETVGYQVRFEEVSGPRTRLRFVTEGVLTRRLLSDTQLKGVSAVVLDEFHERHLDGDLALGLLRRLQATTRPDLKIVVMSATLDAAPIAQYLDNCPIVRSEGRAFPLQLDYTGYSAAPLEQQVAHGVETLLSEGETGDTLVFLPGTAEIRRAIRELEPIARRRDILLVPLFGELSPAEQDMAVQKASKQKIIVSTNVAESSVTVEGVTAVIDSGLARIAGHSHWTGLPILEVQRVSQASAKQRAGRAGRTAPGRVIRLYAEEDFRRRPEVDRPEIVREDLSGMVLGLRAMGLSLDEIPWLDAPPSEAVAAANALLDRLGATGESAKQLARLPVEPRLSRVVQEAMRRGVGESGCALAGLLASGVRIEKGDILEAMDQPMDDRVRRQVDQLKRAARPPKQAKHNDEALLISVLAGFPDRVARRRAGNTVMLTGGMGAEVFGHPRPYEFLLALDAEERKERGAPLIRLTARMEPEWLIDLFPERVVEKREVVWNRQGERAEAISSLEYDGLVLEESRGPANEEEAAAVLAHEAVTLGVERFVDPEALVELQARIAFAGVEAIDIEGTLRELCYGLKRFAELRKVASTDLLPLLEQRAGRLDELAPAKLKLAGGRWVKVHYDLGKPPWIESRLQDFFGMKETPRIGRDRTPVVVHLLAPNHRAVQTTTDLAGFWQRLYPEVRRELMRRYPRHQWPEKPV